MKKCPFCKSEIETSLAQCSICKRILLERFPTAEPTSQRIHTESRSNKEPEQKTHTYYAPPKAPSHSKKQFQLPKGSGWAISIVGSILLSVMWGGSHSPPNPLPPPLSDLPALTTVADIKPVAATDPSPHEPYRQLMNGTVLYSYPSLSNGSGVLTISNGSGSDAIVKLITIGGRKVFTVYVRAGNSYAIKDINDGIYRLLFSFGSDWDSSQNKFLVNPSAQAFDDTFDFETSDTQYTTYKISLNPTIDGRATTSPINPSEFDKY